MDNTWQNLIETLSQMGLNVSGVADGAPYQDILAGCRSVVVFGSGGTAMWDAMVSDIRTNPTHLTEQDHPIDAFVVRAITAVDHNPGDDRRWVRAAADETTLVDFRPLAQQAGLGWTSRLGLLLHPTFGPWMGLRAACFTRQALPFSTPQMGPGPCPPCSAPCATACPAQAIQDNIDIRRCADFHLESTTCALTCHARQACPEGAPHRYSELQMQYHSNREVGRRALATTLGIEDHRVGVGPHWGDWPVVPSPDQE